MKFGLLNKQRVLFGMLFGVLAANAAWFQQMGTNPHQVSFSSQAPCDLATDSKCQRIVTYNKTVGKVTTTEEAKYFFKLVPKEIPGYTNKFTNETVSKQEGLALEISRESCPGCTQIITEPMPRGKAAEIKAALVQLANEKIDEMAKKDAQAMEKQIELEKKNKEEEKKLAALEKKRERCEVVGDDDKPAKGNEMILCLAGKISTIDDESKRAEAFAKIQLQLRDILVRGAPSEQMKATAALIELGGIENGPEVYQASRAMLAGAKYENEAEQLISKLSRTRRGTAQYTQIATKLKTLSSKIHTDLEVAAERAGSRATGSSIAEANFWVDRLDENMSIALNGRSKEALANLQGRDSVRGGYSISGDIDELDNEGRTTNNRLSARRRAVLNGDRNLERSGERYTSVPQNRGRYAQQSIRGRNSPAYAQGRFNGRADYAVDEYYDDAEYLEFPDDYGYSNRYGAANMRGANRYNGNSRYAPRARGRF